MFFYISFLRPPPLQAAPFGTIPITPQIANDLRTEPFPSSQDIFYSWSQPSSSSSTKPTKLTTWRQATAYKEIPVPVPPGVRDGQVWRLLLSTQPASGSTTIDLGDAALGHAPFPVLSMPIAFGLRGGKGKQEQVERVYQLRAPTRAGEEVPGPTAALRLRITEQTSFDLDKKVWDSGVGLSSWLVGLHAGEEAQAGLRDALFSPEPRNILELGAGTGIVALTLAALRSNTSPSPSPGSENASIASDRIITTDLESAMPLLAHNVSSNSSLFLPTGTVPLPEARVLDWDDETLPDYIQIIGGFDAIIMADVTYNTASFPSLVRTLSALTHLGPKSKPPLILLGYKERDPAERTLWDLARAAVAGLEFAKIGERRGAGGAPVEVWLGQIRSP